VPDGQIGDFPGRAARAPKQLVVDEQAQAGPCPERQERSIATLAGAPERLLAEHREIHIILDANIRPEALAQVSEDIEVFQSRDVWNLADATGPRIPARSEEHTSELQSLAYLVCRLLLEKKNNRSK